jgi:hypothetical protein
MNQVLKKLVFYFLVILTSISCDQNMSMPLQVRGDMDVGHVQDDVFEPSIGECSHVSDVGVCLPELPKPSPFCSQGSVDSDGLCPPAAGRPAPLSECPSARWDDENGILCQQRDPIPPIWSCLPGWERVRLEPALAQESENQFQDFTTCRPYEFPRESCPPGFIFQVGIDHCIPMGHPCPSEDQPWHSEAILRSQAPGYDGRIWYVHPHIGELQIGTSEQPIYSIEDAIERSAPGDIVALAGTTFSESVVIDKKIAVIGACLERTKIDFDVQDSEIKASVVITSEEGSFISNLNITGEYYGLYYNSVGISSHYARSIYIHDVRERGISIENTKNVEIDYLRIEETKENDITEREGVGAYITRGSSVRIKNAYLNKNIKFGIYISDRNTNVEMSNLSVHNTTPQESDRMLGIGVGVFNHARTDIRQGWLKGNHDIGVIAQNKAVIDLRDCIVEETDISRVPDELEGLTAKGSGLGIACIAGSSVSANRLWVRKNKSHGLFVGDIHSVFFGEDLIVEQTQERGRVLGRGIETNQGELYLNRTIILDNYESGLLCSGEHASVHAEDIIVMGTKENRGERNGVGIEIQDKCQSNFNRILISKNRGSGVQAYDQDTKIRLVDARIEKTKNEYIDHETLGVGLYLVDGVKVELERINIKEMHNYGIVLDNYSELVGRDVSVQNTINKFNSDAITGTGLFMSYGSHAVLKRAIFSFNQNTGIYLGGGSQLTLQDSFIQNTLEGNKHSGVGLGVSPVNTVLVERTVFSNNKSSAISANQSNLILLDLKFIENKNEIGASLYMNKSNLSSDRLVMRDEARAAVLSFGSNMEMKNLRVEGIIGNSLMGGRALHFQDGGISSIYNAKLKNIETIGVFVYGDTKVNLQDVTFEEAGQRAINLQNQATMSILRSKISDSLDIDVFVNQSNLIVNDLTLASSTKTDRVRSRGIQAQFGASVDASRVSVRGRGQYGVLIGGRASIGKIKELFISDIRLPCEDNTGTNNSIDCSEKVGTGILWVDEAKGSMENFYISHCDHSGVQVYNAECLINSGAVYDSYIACNIEEDDLSLLGDDVVCVGEGAHISSLTPGAGSSEEFFEAFESDENIIEEIEPPARPPNGEQEYMSRGDVQPPSRLCLDVECEDVREIIVCEQCVSQVGNTGKMCPDHSWCHADLKTCVSYESCRDFPGCSIGHVCDQGECVCDSNFLHKKKNFTFRDNDQCFSVLWDSDQNRCSSYWVDPAVGRLSIVPGSSTKTTLVSPSLDWNIWKNELFIMRSGCEGGEQVMVSLSFMARSSSESYDVIWDSEEKILNCNGQSQELVFSVATLEENLSVGKFQVHLSTPRPDIIQGVWIEQLAVEGSTLCRDETGCLVHQYCSQGICVPDLCFQGLRVCNDRVLWSCNEYGSAMEVLEECEFSCGDGYCQEITNNCEPGEVKRCWVECAVRYADGCVQDSIYAMVQGIQICQENNLWGDCITQESCHDLQEECQRGEDRLTMYQCLDGEQKVSSRNCSRPLGLMCDASYYSGWGPDNCEDLCVIGEGCPVEGQERSCEVYCSDSLETPIQGVQECGDLCDVQVWGPCRSDNMCLR